MPLRCSRCHTRCCSSSSGEFDPTPPPAGATDRWAHGAVPRPPACGVPLMVCSHTKLKDGFSKSNSSAGLCRSQLYICEDVGGWCFCLFTSLSFSFKKDKVAFSPSNGPIPTGGAWNSLQTGIRPHFIRSHFRLTAIFCFSTTAALRLDPRRFVFPQNPHPIIPLNCNLPLSAAPLVGSKMTS